MLQCQFEHKILHFTTLEKFRALFETLSKLSILVFKNYKRKKTCFEVLFLKTISNLIVLKTKKQKLVIGVLLLSYGF
jgi:hypothetical protein